MMKETLDVIKLFFFAVGGYVGLILGECDGFLYALVLFIVFDYITGVMRAITERKLSSYIGFRGIFKKVLIFILVAISNIVDVNLLGEGSAIRTAVIFFYISNEGISIIENSVKMGLKVPKKLENVLKKLVENEGDR